MYIGKVIKPEKIHTPIKSNLCKFFQYRKSVKLRNTSINNPLLLKETEDSFTTENPLFTP